jgi:hypothetical protein
MKKEAGKQVKLVKLYDSELIKKGYKSSKVVQDGLQGKPAAIEDDGCYVGTEEQVQYLKGRGYNAKRCKEE